MVSNTTTLYFRNMPHPYSGDPADIPKTVVPLENLVHFKNAVQPLREHPLKKISIYLGNACEFARLKKRFARDFDTMNHRCHVAFAIVSYCVDQSLLGSPRRSLFRHHKPTPPTRRA